MREKIALGLAESRGWVLPSGGLSDSATGRMLLEQVDAVLDAAEADGFVIGPKMTTPEMMENGDKHLWVWIECGANSEFLPTGDMYRAMTNAD